MSDFLRHSPQRWGTDPAPPDGQANPATLVADDRWRNLNRQGRRAVIIAYLSWPMNFVAAVAALVTWRHGNWPICLPAGWLFGQLAVCMTGLWLMLRGCRDVFERRMRFTAWSSLMDFMTLVGLTGAFVYACIFVPGGAGPHPWVLAAVCATAAAVDGRAMWTWRQWRRGSRD